MMDTKDVYRRGVRKTECRLSCKYSTSLFVLLTISVVVWYGRKKYDEAKRLLQLAIDLGNYNDYNHFMLAVSIWASEKNREKTLHHLKVAQDKYMVTSYNYLDSYYPEFLKTPEFSDVKDDPEFLKALGQKPNNN